MLIYYKYTYIYTRIYSHRVKPNTIYILFFTYTNLSRKETYVQTGRDNPILPKTAKTIL